MSPSLTAADSGLEVEASQEGRRQQLRSRAARLAHGHAAVLARPRGRERDGVLEGEARILTGLSAGSHEPVARTLRLPARRPCPCPGRRRPRSWRSRSAGRRPPRRRVRRRPAEVGPATRRGARAGGGAPGARGQPARAAAAKLERAVRAKPPRPAPARPGPAGARPAPSARGRSGRPARAPGRGGLSFSLVSP